MFWGTEEACVCRCLQEPKEGIGSLDNIVTGGFELPKMGAANQTLVPLKSSVLISKPSLMPTNVCYFLNEIDH